MYNKRMQDENQPETPWEFKPGDTIAPKTQAPDQPAAMPEQSPPPASPPETAAAPAPLSEEPLQPQTSTGSITWTASEFIAHSKSINWYLALAGVALLLAATIYLLTKDKISSAVVIVAALALAAYGGRQPRQLQYSLNDQGLTIGEKFFPYQVFRSFALMDEDAFASIAFLPLKRFGQLTTIYFDPNDEEAIVTLLSERLPLEPRQHDVVDRFMKRIRF